MKLFKFVYVGAAKVLGCPYLSCTLRLKDYVLKFACHPKEWGCSFLCRPRFDTYGGVTFACFSVWWMMPAQDAGLADFFQEVA